MGFGLWKRREGLWGGLLVADDVDVYVSDGMNAYL